MNVLLLKVNKNLKNKLNCNILIPHTLTLNLLEKLKIIKNKEEFKKYLIENKIKRIIIDYD